ncbi:MAG: DUF4388 domain-containing protein, partial [Deltaproteobacteria bacterium]|nr:DUF4388 domain-containing protein [Deltaproteobacteria bacterium]
LRIDGKRAAWEVVEGVAIEENAALDMLERHVVSGFLEVVGEGGERLRRKDAEAKREVVSVVAPSRLGALALNPVEEAVPTPSSRMTLAIPEPLASRLWDEKPGVKPGLDITTRDLDMMQGFLVSRIDGATRVADLAQLCGFDRLGALGAVAGLVVDGVVAVSPAVDREIRVLAGDVDAGDALDAFTSSPGPVPAPAEANDDVAPIELARTWRKIKPAGKLADTPFLTLLRFAIDERQTGVLRVAFDKHRRELFLQDGVVVCAATTHPDDDLGELLRAAERLKGKDHDRYKALVAGGGKGPVEALVEIGVVKGDDAVLALRYRDEKVIEALLRASLDNATASYEFVGKKRLPAGLTVTQPTTPATMFRFMMEATPEETTRRFAADNLDKYVLVRKNPRVPISALRFRKRDDEFFALISGPVRRIREVFLISTTNRLRSALYLQTLVDLGVLELSASIPESLKKKETPRDRLDDKLRRTRGRNHFEVLEVQEVASRDEVEAAFARLTAEYELSRFDKAKDATALTELHQLLERSYRELIDDAKRRAYRERVVGRERLMTLAVAEFEKGEDLLLLRRKYQSAVVCFQTACELAPWEPDFLAFLGLAHFKYVFPDPNEVQNAIKMIDRALALAPDSPRVYICLAIVNAETGNKQLARQLLDRASACKKRTTDISDLIASIRAEIV